MNKYQEALETVEKELGRRPTIVSVVLKNKHIDDLKELVDRATPKKPVLFGALSSKVKVGECQKCGTPSMSGRDNYCYECGQALDWTNESEQIAKGETK